MDEERRDEGAVLNEDKLVMQWERSCYQWAHRYRVPGMNFEDLAQEFRIEVVKAGRTWSPRGSKFSTYLFRCFRNKVSKLLEFALHAKRSPAEPLPEDASAPDNCQSGLLLIDCLNLCKNDIERDIIRLIWAGERAVCAELSRTYGITSKSIERRKARLMARLRVELGGEALAT